MSPKDICTIDLLPKIAKAGVYSLKIEGRMKRPEYTAGVVRIYRKYVDHYIKYGEKDYHVSEEDKKELRLLFNRDGFSRGYYEKHNGRDLIALAGKKASEQEKRAYETLTASLRRDYVETVRKIPVTGTLYAKAGAPMRLELAAPGAGVGLTVYGECPQVPKNQPMEKEQLERQLRRTGTASFAWTELRIRTDGPLFVPVQALNQLRRDGFSKLTEAVVQARWRASFTGAAGEGAAGGASDRDRDGSVRATAALHISVETEAQLQEVLSMAESLKAQEMPLRTVYVDAEGLEERLPELIRRIHEVHLDAWVMLPSVFRQKTARRYEERAGWWAALPADGYVIRNLEEYRFLQGLGTEKDLVLDHNVYTFNRKSCAYWKERGIRYLTSPLELNSRELREISSEDHIQIIYGRYPMMVTAGCLHKTLEQCRHKPEIWILKDRYQKEFPVKNCCRDCYNVIYNSQALYLLDQMEEVQKLGAGAYRILFTTEGREEVRKVLAGLAERKKPEGSFTRGHFKRGVE